MIGENILKRSIGTKFWAGQVFLRKLKEHGNHRAGQPNTYAREKLAGLRWNSLTNGGRFLRSDPLLFCVVNVKEVIDVVP